MAQGLDLDMYTGTEDMKSTDEVRISPSGTLSDGTKCKQLQQQHTHHPVDVKTVTKSARYFDDTG